MTDLTVRFFGGPCHNKSFAVDPGLPRFEVMSAPVLPVYNRFDVDDQVPNVSYRKHTYYFERFAESAIYPRRRKTVRVAIFEGAKLTAGEDLDLRREISTQPWVIDKASILEDFEQWFSEVAYRHTGKLVWEGKELRWQK